MNLVSTLEDINDRLDECLVARPAEPQQKAIGVESDALMHARLRTRQSANRVGEGVELDRRPARQKATAKREKTPRSPLVYEKFMEEMFARQKALLDKIAEIEQQNKELQRENRALSAALRTARAQQKPTIRILHLQKRVPRPAS